MPSSKTARLGVWENDNFIGAVVFAWGANLRLAGEYGLKMIECVELCRVALTTHETPVSKIISVAVKMLKRSQPGIRLIVSYADPQQNHIGIVYQAAGWLYVGEAAGTAAVLLEGKNVHRRTVNSKFGTSSIDWLRKHVNIDAASIPTMRKHKYLLPLDEETETKLLPLRKPYPKRAVSNEALRLDTIQEGAVQI
jgi:hypothetical protein